MKSCPSCQATYPSNFAVCPQDGTPLVDTTAWSEGTLIRGKYRILSKVGQGGMGAVYKALHVAFDELRALKVISRELMSDELFVKRFKHEAIITRKLQHPNAVRVDDIDEAEDGRPFIVMEYIEGKSLRKLIQEEGALPVPRVCSIVKQVASALDAAHRLAMIHRDIKPDNVVLVETPEGEQAKVLDFGIAKIKEARLGASAGMTLTGTGVVIGTPQYMSPEQAMGKRGDELDGRSDIYSLGVVMYQMLTGDLPFKADTTMEMLLAHLQRPPTPIRVSRPELQIADSIANLVMRMLEKTPEMRPATAKALIEEIERAQPEAIPLGETRVMQPSTIYPQPPARVREPGLQLGMPAAPAERPAAAPPLVARPAAAPAPVPAQPRPVAAAPAIPRATAPVRPAAPPARPQRWGVWVSIAILIVGGGGGAWYIVSRRPSPPPVIRTPMPSAPEAGVSSSSAKAEERRATPVESSTSSTSAVPSSVAAGPPRRTTTPSPASDAGTTTASRPRERPVQPPVRVDSGAARAALTLGNLYFDRGEYDKAIVEYESGLLADPSNSKLREALARARRAKTAEERVLQ